MVLRDPSRARFLAERDEVQRGWLVERPASAVAFAQADELLERWTDELGSLADRRPWWVRRYWHQRDSRGGVSYGPELAAKPR